MTNLSKLLKEISVEEIQQTQSRVLRVSEQYETDSNLPQVLRMVAPIFPPQHHVYGALGELDINSRNVMMLFYNLACSTDENVAVDIKTLRKARVMKIYSDVIDNLLELHFRKNNKQGFVVPNFDKYLEKLVQDNCLQGRSNKFDLR